MLEEIINAVTGRQEIEFVYDGRPRVVQPAAVGTHKDTGNVFLRGYQVGGQSNSRQPPLWDMFLLAKIVALNVTDRSFAEDPPHYSPGDKHRSSIAAQL